MQAKPFEPALGGLTQAHASLWGFRLGPIGTHTSRTIMLEELAAAMAAAPATATRPDYEHQVVIENCLGKRTAATRRLSFQRLTELYALDSRVLLFRVLRDLWRRHPSGRPLLALLLALARDPLLRATAPSVLNTPPSHEFARQTMKDALHNSVDSRLNDATVDKVVRNASSSWTQSGHLSGRSRKKRQRVVATPAVAAYALLIGYATGKRGRLLFETPWMSVLDADSHALIDLAVDAKRLGLLELKQSGSMIDVTFPAMFSRKEQEQIDGAHRHTR